MKILVINGSPRGERSNTLRLTRAFTRGLCSAAPGSEVEELDLRCMNLHECSGCFTCWTKTPGRCVHPDDMNGALLKYVEADALIFSFPLYYFSLPSRLKLFLDRTLPLSLPVMNPDSPYGGHPLRDERLLRKRMALISTCGFYTAEGNYGAVRAQFDRLWGAGNYAALFCGQGELFRRDQTHPIVLDLVSQRLELLQRAGAEFAQGSVSAETAEAAAQPLLPRQVFESATNASWKVQK